MPHGEFLSLAPELEGWLTLGDAADVLGVTRQAVHLMAQAGTFASLHRVGQHCYVVSTQDAEHVRDRRERAGRPACDPAEAARAGLRLAGQAVALDADAADLAEALDVLGILSLLREERQVA